MTTKYIDEKELVLMLESEIDICKELFDYASDLCASREGIQKETANEMRTEYYIRYRQTQEILRYVKSYIKPVKWRDV